MSKRTQKVSGEERVTAKSKRMMNLVSRCSERTPDVLVSTASESPEKTRHESQQLLSSWNEQHQRTGRPVYKQTPGLFTEHTDKFIVDDDDMDYDTVEESVMSLISRSFLHKVNDRVRTIQDQSSKDATQDSNKHSVTWGNVFDIGSICIHVKELLRNFHCIKNTGKELTMKQMFDI